MRFCETGVCHDIALGKGGMAVQIFPIFFSFNFCFAKGRSSVNPNLEIRSDVDFRAYTKFGRAWPSMVEHSRSMLPTKKE